MSNEKPLILKKAWHFFIGAEGELADLPEEGCRLTVGLDAERKIYLFGPALVPLSEGQPVSEHVAGRIGSVLLEAAGEAG